MIVLEASIKGKKKRKYFFYGKEIPIKTKFIWFFESLHNRERSKTERIIIQNIIDCLNNTSNLKNISSIRNDTVNIEIYVIIPNKL